MNRITLLGNSGADAEVKQSAVGTAYCSFTLATSERQKDGTFTSTWHRVKMFGKMASLAGPMIKKGSKVLVDGKMQYSEYTGKDGIKKNSAEVMAFQVFVIQKDVERSSAYSSGHTPEPGSESVNEQFPEMDIPF